MYTSTQLKRCKKAQLLELIRYHGFGSISKRTKKGEIIDYILEKIHLDIVTDVSETGTPMSARVKRIKELNK